MRVAISSTNAARHLDDCLARIRDRGDVFVITSDDQPVAELHPAPLSHRGTWSELTMAIESLPYDDTFADDLEKVNDSDQIPASPWD